MSATFYDLMRYAKTGIAAPDMTQYDNVKACAMFGGDAEPKNLYDYTRTDGVKDGYFINKNSRQEQALYTYEISYPIAVTVGQQYRWTFNADDGQKHSSPTVGFYDDTDTMIGVASHRDEITSFTFTVPSGCTYIRASVYKATKDQASLMKEES